VEPAPLACSSSLLIQPPYYSSNVKNKAPYKSLLCQPHKF
jgi:hypothetical protein